MRSLRFLSLFLLPAALVVAGCNEQTAPATSDAVNESVEGISQISDLPRAFGSYGNPVVRLSLGRTVLTEVPAVPGIGDAWSGFRRHSFIAYQRQDDGTDAVGWTRLDQRGDEGFQSFATRGRVTCMNHLEGVDLVLVSDETIERVGDPANGFPGLPLPVPGDDGTVFAFRDNGRGPHADPDQSTTRVSTTVAVAKGICENPPAQLIGLALQTLLPLERGFIKVIDR